VHKPSGNLENSSDNLACSLEDNKMKKRHQFKKKRQKTLARQISIAKDENPDYNRNLVS
jgi:hypothetical protein